jgi:hypothetical protein
MKKTGSAAARLAAAPVSREVALVVGASTLDLSLSELLAAHAHC